MKGGGPGRGGMRRTERNPSGSFTALSPPDTGCGKQATQGDLGADFTQGTNHF